MLLAFLIFIGLIQRWATESPKKTVSSASFFSTGVLTS